jgi:PmbA protein
VRVVTTAAKAGIAGRAVARADAAAVARGRFTSRRLADFAAPHLGPELARRAVHLIGAGPAAPARLTVVLPPDLAADLLAALADALAAPAVSRGASFLAGRLGKRIGNDLLNVIDDATLPGALGSAPADDEGTPTGYHHPIVGGRLAGWLADTGSAARLGTRSTGNAVRASFRTPPVVGPRNLILTPGHRTPAEIIAGIEHGLLIEEAERAAPFDPARGNYALRAAGRLIVHGRPGRPVRGIVAGLLPEMLVNLAALGHDLAFAGPIAAPTIAIAGMSVTPAA